MNRRRDDLLHTGSRWLRFNAVGALGVAVQLGSLALLTRVFAWDYLLSTAVAVELTLLHNFVWHERFTWRDRTAAAQRSSQVLARLAGFHAGNGAVSLAGNLLLMRWLVGALGFSPLLANLAAVLACSLVNFALGDRLIFRAGQPLSPEETARLAGLATTFCGEAPRGAADLLPHRPAIRHPHQVALRERQEQQRRDRRERQPDPDVAPG